MTSPGNKLAVVFQMGYSKQPPQLVFKFKVHEVFGGHPYLICPMDFQSACVLEADGLVQSEWLGYKDSLGLPVNLLMPVSSQDAT